MSGPGIVIIGAGEAGARAALGLRARQYGGSIALIGAEPGLPYERPPLSKAVMAAAPPADPPVTLSEAAMARNEIDYRAGTGVAAIDRAGRAAVLADGQRLPYQRLLIATGAAPRRLAVPGAEAVAYLRSAEDARLLRTRLRPGTRLAIIGGGLIGLEIAACAIGLGCQVTIIEQAANILMRAVPPALAAMIEARHRAAGVGFRLGAAIARIEARGDGHAVILADGEALPCDAILAGIGVLPETGLAAAAGLALENGIRVDATLATDDPEIFAAGDCCSFPHPLYEGRRLRLESWRNAQDQGNHAAANLLGAAAPFAAVPWFWSDQYELCLQIAGLPQFGTTIIPRDTGPGAKFLFHLDADGRLVAASALGPLGAIARDIKIAELLIAQRAHPAPEILAAPDARLKALLRQAAA